MRKFILLFLCMMFCTAGGCAPDDGAPEETGAPEITVGEQEPEEKNILSAAESDFENLTDAGKTRWSVFGDGTAQLSDRAHSGSKCFSVTARPNEWTSPSLDLFPYIQKSGAGFYKISLWFALEGELDKINALNFGTLIRSDSAADINSFISEYSSNYYCRLENVSINPDDGEWIYLERGFYVEEDDLDGIHSWKFCFDMLTTDASTVYIDDCVLIKERTEMNNEPYIPAEAVVWTAGEIILAAQKNYDDPFSDVTLDAVFTHTDGKTITVPGFWDGGNIWRVRFMLPEAGTWKFIIKSDAGNDAGLNGIGGQIKCTEYTGNLEIYRRGFLKTEKNIRYFMYDDGTPFFYLGDTHWNMPAEEYDAAGEHAGDIKADSHFKYIVDTRVKQGFTVYQSEPLGASYNLADGLTEADIYGFRQLDARFKYIADSGLVHANAALFFTSELANRPEAYSEAYLERLARYWVARYGAYPVLWTLAQECDNDFYFDRGDQKTFDAENNPWKKVCEYFYKYDPYKSPMSAHQEYASMDAVHGVNASRSAFRDLPGHSWYAAQWSPALNSQLDFEIARDYYINGQGKPAVNYEGRYDYLWTKHFGARVQGWTAFLNGMCGYGYGAIDIWLYKSTYNIDAVSDDGIDKITPEDKNIYWSESVNFETAYQMGYMRSFFESIAWHRLVPRFDDSGWIIPEQGAFYSLATDGSDLYVCYFYNKNEKTAKLRGLQDSGYMLRWFDPRENTFLIEKIIFPSDGTYEIGKKPDNEDWVLVLEKTDKK